MRGERGRREDLTIVVLAGGFGTRLGSLTQNTPKPLVPVKGVPALDHVLGRLIRLGAADIRVVGAYLGHMVEHHLRQRWPGCRYIDEGEPRGTANAFWAAADRPFLQRVLVCNADTVLESHLVQLVDLDGWQAAMAVAATLAPAPWPLGQRDGAVTLDPSGGLTFAGYMVARTDALGPPGRRRGSLESEVLEPLVRSGRVRATPVSGFCDMGTPEGLQRMEGLVWRFGRGLP